MKREDGRGKMDDEKVRGRGISLVMESLASPAFTKWAKPTSQQGGGGLSKCKSKSVIIDIIISRFSVQQ